VGKRCLSLRLRTASTILSQIKVDFWHYFAIVKCQVEHYFALKENNFKVYYDVVIF
jgi:hypothetical protein